LRVERMAGAWGSGKSLAERLRESAAAEAKIAVAKPPAPEFVPVHPKGVNPQYYYQLQKGDGSFHFPNVLELEGNITVAISLLAIRNDTLLMMKSEEEEVSVTQAMQGVTIQHIDSQEVNSEPENKQIEVAGLWSIPDGLLSKIETIPDAAKRILKDQCGLSFVPLGIASVENYPSLKKNWIRLCVVGEIEGDIEAKPDVYEMISISQVLKEKVQCSSCEFLPALRVVVGLPQVDDENEDEVEESKQALEGLGNFSLVSHGSPLPSCDPAIGFPYLLVDLLLAHQDTVLLQKYPLPSSQNDDSKHGAGEFWSLPTTHADKGEDVGFSSSRMARALFGFVVNPASIAHVQHNGRSDLGLDGLRVTLCATLDDLTVDDSFVAPSTAFKHEWCTLARVRDLAEQGLLRSDLEPVLQSVLKETDSRKRGVPLIRIVTA